MDLSQTEPPLIYVEGSQGCKHIREREAGTPHALLLVGAHICTSLYFHPREGRAVLSC